MTAVVNKPTKLFLILLRVAVGWFFLYQGITAILDPQWSVLPFISNAHTFPDFYMSMSDSITASYISYLIKGLYVLIGACIVSGLFVRVGAFLGALIMLFFYFPLLQFPYVRYADVTYYIVDYHLMMAILLIYLFAARAGEVFGLGTLFKFSRY
jgi:thiosulfate dehydrogenase [quinone] large subunit